MRRRLQVLELPTPFDPRAGRQGHSFDLRLGGGDKGTDIAAADVGLYDDPALATFTADLVQPLGMREPRELAQRDGPAQLP